MKKDITTVAFTAMLVFGIFTSIYVNILFTKRKRTLSKEDEKLLKSFYLQRREA